MTDSGRIEILYRAAPNAREGYGWVPLLRVNGRSAGSEWSSSGYDKDVALTMARQMADEEAARYVGDWDITIAQEPEPGSKPRKGTSMAKAASWKNEFLDFKRDAERSGDDKLAQLAAKALAGDRSAAKQVVSVITNRNHQQLDAPHYLAWLFAHKLRKGKELNPNLSYYVRDDGEGRGSLIEHTSKVYLREATKAELARAKALGGGVLTTDDLYGSLRKARKSRTTIPARKPRAKKPRGALSDTDRSRLRVALREDLGRLHESLDRPGASSEIAALNSITTLDDARRVAPKVPSATALREALSEMRTTKPKSRNGYRASLASIRARHKHELVQLKSAHGLEVLALKDRHHAEREEMRARHKRELADAEKTLGLLRRAKRKA